MDLLDGLHNTGDLINIHDIYWDLETASGVFFHFWCDAS